MPIFIVANDTDNLVMYNDALGKGLGCMLMQTGKVIVYAFRQCKSTKAIILAMT